MNVPSLFSTDISSSFGFIKYHNFEDAEDCIRGFHYLGYEVSFARVNTRPSLHAWLPLIESGIILLQAQEVL